MDITEAKYEIKRCERAVKVFNGRAGRLLEQAQFILTQAHAPLQVWELKFLESEATQLQAPVWKREAVFRRRQFDAAFRYAQRATDWYAHARVWDLKRQAAQTELNALVNELIDSSSIGDYYNTMTPEIEGMVTEVKSRLRAAGIIG